MATIEVNNLHDFELEHIFECGQCFRWHREEDGSYTGVNKYGVFNIKKVSSDTILIDGTLVKDDELNSEKMSDEDRIRLAFDDYFDLKCDYSKIKTIISKDDINMQNAIKYGYGIRILNQDPWEMVISYIISAANNIPRISKTIENLSLTYGKEIRYGDKVYHMFPTPLELSKASISDLRNLNLGFRDKYVYNATQKIANKEINLDEIINLNYLEAKKVLMQLDGIGDKVASCILLFSMRKTESFPVDTWIKKVMAQLYNESKDIKKIAKFAEEKFGKYGGIAQQYLFYYMRNGIE